MSECYKCLTPLTASNQSEEHLILNAMGGMLKSKKLLCKPCNNKMGDTADAELAKQFQFLSGHLQVKRDRGAIPTTKGGVLPDGSGINLLEGIIPSYAQPQFKVGQQGDELTYNIVARSKDEMRTLLGRVAKIHPGFDIEVAMTKAEFKNERLREQVKFSQTFGGDLAFKSIAKTAVNFYMLNNGDRKNIEHFIPYIFGEENLNVVKHYHAKKPLYRKEAGEIIHLLHLVGNKHKGFLYCYVEFFSTHSYIVLLSENYTGKNIHFTYAYNLITNKEVKKDVTLKVDIELIKGLSNNMRHFFLLVKEKTDRVMAIANKIHTYREIDRITKNAVKDIFEIKFGHAKIVTRQMTEEFSERIAYDFVKFIFGEDTVETALRN